MTRTEAQTRVARGAAWLDARAPGWAHRINIQTLSLVWAEDCVLGQLFGDFNDFVEATFAEYQNVPCVLDLDMLIEAHLGFDIDHDGDASQLRTLQDCWVETIADRVCRKDAELRHDEAHDSAASNT